MGIFVSVDFLVSKYLWTPFAAERALLALPKPESATLHWVTTTGQSPGRLRDNFLVRLSCFCTTCFSFCFKLSRTLVQQTSWEDKRCLPPIQNCLPSRKKIQVLYFFTKSWLVFISGRLTIFSLELNKANRHLFYKYYFALVLCRYSFLCKHVIYLLNTKHEKYWKNIYALLDKILLIHYIIIH